MRQHLPRSARCVFFISESGLSIRPVAFRPFRGWGFTLIELLLVLVVLSVLAGSVVVSLAGRHQTYELQTAAKDVASALTYAHANARLNSQPYRIVFGDRGNGFRIEAQSSAQASGWRPAHGIPGRQHRLAGDARVAAVGHAESLQTEGPFVVEFSSSPAASADRIVLTNTKRENITIKIMLATGQIEVSEVEDSHEGEAF